MTPDPYVEWFRRALAERCSAEGVPYARDELVAIVRGVEMGGMVMGCMLSTEAITTLQREMLPQLRAMLDAMPSPPSKPPKRQKPRFKLGADERQTIENLARFEVAPPFGPRRSFAVGGLRAAGFAPNTEMLLVVSSRGKGVFDCASGRRVGRDAAAEDGDGYPDWTMGIEPIASVCVPLDGFEGGEALPHRTCDGIAVAMFEEVYTLVWLYPAASVSPAVDAAHGGQLVGKFEDVRAVGFSDSGRSFIVAEQHTLHFWSRG